MVNKHAWFLTINNPLDSEMQLCQAAMVDSVENRRRLDLEGNYYATREPQKAFSNSDMPFKGLAYFGFAEEVGKLGTKHLHCIIVFKKPKSFNAIKKLFPRANIQALRGTYDEAITYVRKDGRYHSVKFVPLERVKTYIDEDNKLARLSAAGDLSLEECRNEVAQLRSELHEFKELITSLITEKKLLNSL